MGTDSHLDDRPGADSHRAEGAPAAEGHLIETREGIDALLAGVKRVAVLGMKTEAQANQPAFYVAKYLHDTGLEVVPVPVYYPDVTEILGLPVYRRLVDVPGDIDLLDVFRRPQDLPAHVDDILAKRPRAVWFQLGIRNDEVARRLVSAGIDVVQDRCLMVDLRRWRNAR
jgi:predicted CoA-binding protein